MQILDLSSNALGDGGIRKILAAISKAQTILILKLDSNEITHHGCGTLHSFLISCRSIKTLSLRMNKLGDKGVARFAQALEGKQAAIQNLDLSNCEITKSGFYFML